MEAPWETLEPRTQEALLLRLRHALAGPTGTTGATARTGATGVRASRMTPQGVANSLYGLSLMRCDWKALGSVQSLLQDALCAALPRMNEQEVAGTVYS